MITFLVISAKTVNECVEILRDNNFLWHLAFFNNALKLFTVTIKFVLQFTTQRMWLWIPLNFFILEYILLNTRALNFMEIKSYLCICSHVEQPTPPPLRKKCVHSEFISVQGRSGRSTPSMWSATFFLQATHKKFNLIL